MCDESADDTVAYDFEILSDLLSLPDTMRARARKLALEFNVDPLVILVVFVQKLLTNEKHRLRVPLTDLLNQIPPDIVSDATRLYSEIYA